MTASDPVVAYIVCTDGEKRPVFEDQVGQYIIDQDGDVWRGVWYIPPDGADDPIVVSADGKPPS